MAGPHISTPDVLYKKIKVINHLLVFEWSLLCGPYWHTALKKSSQVTCLVHRWTTNDCLLPIVLNKYSRSTLLLDAFKTSETTMWKYPLPRCFQRVQVDLDVLFGLKARGYKVDSTKEVIWRLWDACNSNCQLSKFYWKGDRAVERIECI